MLGTEKTYKASQSTGERTKAHDMGDMDCSVIMQGLIGTQGDVLVYLEGSRKTFKEQCQAGLLASEGSCSGGEEADAH
jgi:hypothetical protein